MSDNVVFFLDVDNTLLDNDQVAAELKAYLDREFGEGCGNLYWKILEQLRTELGYTDYLGAFQRYRVATGFDPRLLEASSFLVDYPFERRVYPGALEVIQ